MKKKYIVIIIVAVVLVAAAITNPGKETHRKEVSKALYSKLETEMQKEMGQGNGFAQLGFAFGSFLFKPLIETLINAMVDVDNYVLFSITKINIQGNPKPVGVGVFGKVFFFKDLDDIKYEDIKKKKNK